MKTRTLLLSALSVGLGLIACDNFVESRATDAPETATLAARLTASGEAEKALLKRTTTVRVTLDTGETTLVRCLQKTVPYDSGKVSFPALRVGMNYALAYEGLVGGTVIWTGTASGSLAKSSNTASLTLAQTDLQLKAPSFGFAGTSISLTTNTDTSLGAKLYWTRNTASTWTLYDNTPFPANSGAADMVWAKDSIDGVIGSEVKFLTVDATGGVVANTTTALKNLAVNEAETALIFDPSTFNYEISVPSGTTKVTITADTAAVDQTLKIEGADAVSGVPTPVSIPSDSTIHVVVTNPKNATDSTRSYTIKVKVSALPDISSALSSLKSSAGTWDATLSTSKTTYTLTVDDTVKSLDLVVKAKSASANISAKISANPSDFLTLTDANPPALGKKITVNPSTSGNLNIYVINLNAPGVTQGYTIKFVLKSTKITPTVPTAPTVTPAITMVAGASEQAWIGTGGARTLKWNPDLKQYVLDTIKISCGSGARARYAVYGASTWTKGTSIPNLSASTRMIFQCQDLVDTNNVSTQVDRLFMLFLPPKITAPQTIFVDSAVAYLKASSSSQTVQYCIGDSGTCASASAVWSDAKKPAIVMNRDSGSTEAIKATSKVWARATQTCVPAGGGFSINVTSPLSGVSFTKATLVWSQLFDLDANGTEVEPKYGITEWNGQLANNNDNLMAYKDSGLVYAVHSSVSITNKAIGYDVLLDATKYPLTDSSFLTFDYKPRSSSTFDSLFIGIHANGTTSPDYLKGIPAKSSGTIRIDMKDLKAQSWNGSTIGFLATTLAKATHITFGAWFKSSTSGTVDFTIDNIKLYK